MEGSRSAACLELARVFTWLGLTSFGGPAAHVALMERELVERRQWLTRDELLDLIGLTQLVPGPNSTELAMAIGQRRAGRAGLIVAGTCFILPAALMVCGIASLYLRYRALPQLAAPLDALKPAVVAVIADAMRRLIPTSAREPRLAVVFGIATAAALLGAPELAVVVAGGLFALATFRGPPPAPHGEAESQAEARAESQGEGEAESQGEGRAGWMALPLLGAGAAVGPSVEGLFTYFFKVGSVLYGSGYVLLAFLRSGLVEELGWLTEAQLLDAISVGQFTPGPVFTTATFIGYLIGGGAGAVAATIGIFAPAFLFIAAAGPLLRHLLLRPWFRPFLDGVNAASLGLLLAVVLRLGASSCLQPLPGLIALLSFGVLARFNLNSAWVMLGAGLLGWATR